jgi:putative iron-only hydrogenase system regulator
MDMRIGVVAILVTRRDSIQRVNTIVSDFSDIVTGRMGVPMPDRNVSIISIVVTGTVETIGAFTGQLGQLPGVRVKSLLTPYRDESGPPDGSD